MPDRITIVSDFYRGGSEDGRLSRTRRGQLEYFVTMYYIHRFAPVRANVLELGAESRVNSPGSVGANWQWRMRPDAIDRDVTKKLREVTHRYRRD